ncbi:hypothetical protein ACFLRB_02485 [Acidobacteriota bacterium]
MGKNGKSTRLTVLTGEELDEKVLGPDHYRGGGWTIDAAETWKLTIRKRVHDPEEENVTVGQNPPG